MQEQHPASPTRRDFLRTSTAVAVGGTVLGTLGFARGVHAGTDETIKVGLVGCGGRGCGAAVQALMADPHTKLVALGDAFSDHLHDGLKGIKNKLVEEEIDPSVRVPVSPDNCFVGIDAYKQVIDSDIDVVLLCTPPHFRPAHMKYAVEKNKHVFAEKPVAVDIPGVKSVMQSCEEAQRKGLSIVSGLCYRYHPGMRETVDRIHAGEIGRVIALNVNYLTSTYRYFPRKAQWSDMEHQLRNWNNYVWLSGDHNCEQHIHSLDKAAWVLRDEPPSSAIGIGGRQSRDPAIGNIYDHFSVVYDYADGTKVIANCRQWSGCAGDVSDHVFGEKGSSNLMKYSIQNDKKWRSKLVRGVNMWQREHDEMFPAIRAGKPINNGLYMCRSNVMAIMGRMAAYTGERVSWERAMSSTEDLTPPSYEWGDLPVAPVAKPGVTKLT